MLLWKLFRGGRIRRLSRELADCRTRSAAKTRIIAALNAEIEVLAATVERDRARVLAETAGFAKQEAGIQ